MADLPTADPFTDAPGTVELRLLAIERAAAALRSGLQVTLAGDAPRGMPALVVLAAEAATHSGLAAFSGQAAAPPVIVLAAAQAALAGATTEIAAFRLRQGEFDPHMLQALADPTRLRQLHQPELPELDMAELPAGVDAAVALAKLAGLLPAVLVAPATGWEGGARIAPADVLGHATLSANTLTRVSEAVVPLAAMADCRVVAFRAPGSGQDHLAILLGRPEMVAEPLVRVHSECFTGDLLGSLRCDCGAQLHGAIARIAAEGAGAVLYLAQEGRGIGLANKLRAYTLQDAGLDTLDANRALGFAADERDFQIAAAMLRQLGLTRIRLLTNNPAKLASLGSHGIQVAARVGLRFASNGVNDGYLATKAQRFGHMLGPLNEA